MRCGLNPRRRLRPRERYAAGEPRSFGLNPKTTDCDLVSVTPAGEPRSLRVSAPGSRRITTPGATGLEEEHDAGLKEQNTHSPGWMAGGSS